MNTELLKPRWKLILDYPNNPFDIGTIFEAYSKTQDWACVIAKDWMNGLKISALEKYPHLFKRLEWWEERTIEEMDSVKYVKDIGDGEIFNCECTYTGMVYIKSNKGNGDMRYTSLEHFLPSTIKEYNAYTGANKTN